jgi:NAD(P)-dependent dehydrogenase (short-subunit alcohol dehydrogenase family)
MEQLEGKVAVVTGAASGIGLALSRRFAAEGMDVVLADVDEAGLAPAVAGIIAENHRAIAVPTDCSDRASVHALRDAARDAFGAVHILCNNAGIAPKPGSVIDPNLEHWRLAMDVNLFGLLYGVEAFLPGMLEQGDGYIVNTASRQGLVRYGGSSAYSTSKAAAVALTESLHIELAARNAPVGVSVLCPGGVRTGMLRAPETLPDDVDPGFRKLITERYQESVTPEAIAGLTLQAIRERRLYILTHGETVGWIGERLDKITTDATALGLIH